MHFFSLISQKYICPILGLDARKPTCLRGIVNNTGADQPGHLRSLINTFVIRFLESIIYKLATGETHFFGNHKDKFCRVEAHIVLLTLYSECEKFKTSESSNYILKMIMPLFS